MTCCHLKTRSWRVADFFSPTERGSTPPGGDLSVRRGEAPNGAAALGGGWVWRETKG